MLFDQHPPCIKNAAVVITLVGVEHRQRQLIQLVFVVVRQDALVLQRDDKTGDGGRGRERHGAGRQN